MLQRGWSGIYYITTSQSTTFNASFLSTIVKYDQREGVFSVNTIHRKCRFWEHLACSPPALADKGEFRRVMVHWASYGPNTPCATPAMIHALMYIHNQPSLLPLVIPEQCLHNMLYWTSDSPTTLSHLCCDICSNVHTCLHVDTTTISHELANERMLLCHPW